MSLAMSLRGRGAAGSAARTATVLSKFGISSSAMARRLDRYVEILAAFGVRPTWPATACVFARHPDLLRRFAGNGAELAVHGLVHGDHASLDRHDQLDTIARAVKIFERAGVAAVGFRGPYLRYNEATLEVLAELGFRYHSSQAISYPLVASDPDESREASYRRALELYSARDARTTATRPHLRHGLVDIPVAVPDDEILLERLRTDRSESTAQWLHILDETYRRGDLFTVQLHPERIDDLAPALEATLREARRREPPVFIARLDELAEWWQRRSRFQLLVTRTADGRQRIRLDADDDGTLLVRGLDVPSSPWYGKDAISKSRDFEVVGGRIPIAAVSRRTPQGVRDFLNEEGVPFEVSDDGDRYGARVDLASGEWNEADVLDTIEAAPGPLVRISRWPRAARSALAVTGDIDALTIYDFAVRSWETRRQAHGGARRS